jgi:glutamate---cysteine ligase / carboxylate-amine ligase
MAYAAPSLTIGIEEEYLLVDPQSRNLIAEPTPELWEDAERRLGGSVMREMLRAQLEVATTPHSSMVGLANDLKHLRRTVADLTRDHGAAYIAASTHPFALWWEQRHTEHDRYQMLASDLAVVGQRIVICGMHVHVAVEDPELRIDLMNQVSYFLPHLLALSTSSPFWGGRNTGLKSYRMNVFRTMPRTGLPEQFSSWAEYQRHVEVLVGAGLIEDGSKIWWDIRPSTKYPTLEMRVSDICTRAEDAIAIATVYRCLLHMLFRLRTQNQRWRQYAGMLVAENMWRAQRFGTGSSLMDYGLSQLVPFHELVEELIEVLRPDAEELDCVQELQGVQTIINRGTSADRQIANFEQALAEGASNEEALKSVVDELIIDTVAGV